MYKEGEFYLVTTNAWFVAPDGQQYNSVYGCIKEILDDSVLGIKTNRHSTNWFLSIGNMVIAGCQIHYAIKCERRPSSIPPKMEGFHEGRCISSPASTSRIYFADK